MRAKVVTAFVPLKVKHLTSDAYHELGRQLEVACGDRFRCYDQFPLDDCWLAKEDPPLVPASETPLDRYETREDHARSNIVQHSRTQWAQMAVSEELCPPDWIVWLDLAIMKQGAWLNNQITPGHVVDFLETVEKLPLGIIPFPGIEDRKPVDPTGNNWRFCGSTHIWPTAFLSRIDHAYKFYTREFIRKHKTIPLDLAVWPTVEERSGLPFRWYKAEYDATQLTNLRSVL